MDPTNLLQTPVDQFSAQENQFPPGYMTPALQKSMNDYAAALLKNSQGTVPGTKGGWTVGLQHMIDALVGGNQAYRANQGQLAGRSYDVAGLPTRQIPFAPNDLSDAPPATLPGGAKNSYSKEGTDVIGDMESGGRYDNVTTTVNPRTGQKQSALGKYGVMDFNVGPWTQQILGKAMTPQEFLSNPQAQDLVAKTKLGEYTAKYGPEGAGRAWLGGEGGVSHPERSDAFGTTVGDYGKRYARALGFNGQPATPDAGGQGAIVRALAASKAPAATPGVPSGEAAQPLISPFAVPARPHISEQNFRRTQAGSWLSPEQQKLSSDAYYGEFQPITVPYMGGNVIVNPANRSQQFWSPGVKMDATSEAKGVKAPTPFITNPDGTITYLGEKSQGGAGPKQNTGQVPTSASAPAPLIKNDPIVTEVPDTAPAVPAVPAATPAPATPAVPATPAATPAVTPPAQPQLPLNIRGDVAPTNQVVSNVPMATAGKPVVPGPAETGSDAIAKAQGGLPPTALGIAPPTETGPMGAKVAQALATQPPVGPKGVQTAEVPSKLRELGDYGIDLEHRTKLVDQDAEKYSKNIDDYGRISQIATKSLPQLKVAMQMANDKRYYSGVLSDPYTWLKKGSAALAGTAIGKAFGFKDKAAAAPMEVFDKILSGNIVNDLKVLLGGLGQIRLAEIDLITKSVANRYNTIAANKAVLNMMVREHTQAANVGNIVANYDKGWVLDDKDNWVRRTGATSNADLNTKINDYIQRHPLFSDEEIANINKTLDLSNPVENEKVPYQKTRDELANAAKVPGFTSPASATEAPKTGTPAATAPTQAPATPAKPAPTQRFQYDQNGNRL